MTGAWGLGPLVEVARTLARAGVYTIAVAGRNTEVEQRLRAAAAEEKLIIPFGFTDRIPELMAAANVVVTTSGDTCSEARVVGRSLVLLDVVAGHGRENLQHELERGNADVAPADPDGLLRSVLACFEHVTPPTAQVVQTADAWESAFEAALARIGLSGASTGP
jgi:UDP-N-acetylglucosamine:LPS N-acetylglucosamine transferase